MIPENPRIKQELLDLYNDYAHDHIDRRTFIEKLQMYAVGGVTLPYLLEYLIPKYGRSSERIINDKLVEEQFTFESPSGGGKITGLLCYPKELSGTLPGIVVVHENRGLNPYIEDVGRAAALAGYISLSPDALSPMGGYPGNDDDGRKMQSQRDRHEMLEDFIAAFYTLREHKLCNGRVGTVGFCFGGWITNMMAVRIQDLAASVPYYGSQATVDAVNTIQAPLQFHYAEFDERVNAGREAYEDALRANDKVFESYFYEGANHGFHNYSTPRFDKDAADLAWQRTIEFFDQHLK